MDEISSESLIGHRSTVVMKTNYHQVGIREAVALTAGCFYLLNLTPPVWAGSTVDIVEPVVVHLQAGVTGGEIQTALNSLPAAGGEVILPPETIVLRQPLVLDRDFQTLRGSGPATVLRLADNANCPVIIMGQPVNQPDKIITNLRVADMFIDGNRKNQQRELWRESGEGSEIRNNGITVQAVADSTVENVICARNRSGGLVTTLGVRGLAVRNFEAFDNEFDGLACYLTTNSVFTDLRLHDNPGAGISLDLAFSGNVISNAMLTANDLGIFMRDSRENQFHNIVIRNSRHHGVFMAHSEMQTATGWGPAPRTECARNAFTNLIAINCGGAAFRVNNTTCTNNVIIRPKFEGNLKGGLSSEAPGLVTVR